MSEKVEVLDLIINTLKEHEKRLDDMIIRLELSLDELLEKKSKKNLSSEKSICDNCVAISYCNPNMMCIKENDLRFYK